MSHSFRATQKNVRHKDCGGRDLSLPRVGGFFSLHSTQPPLQTVQQTVLLGRMVKVSAAVSFVVPAIGTSCIALKRSRMKSMQEPKAPDWNDSWNEMFQALFACWFVCLLFDIRAIWLSSAAGLSVRLIFSIAKQRLFQKPKHFHCHYWFGTCSLGGELNKNSHISFLGFFYIVHEWVCPFFKGTPISGSCAEMGVQDLPFSAGGVQAQKLISQSTPLAPTVSFLHWRTLQMEQGLYMKATDVPIQPRKLGTISTNFTGVWLWWQGVHRTLPLLVAARCLDFSGLIVGSD